MAGVVVCRAPFGAVCACVCVCLAGHHSTLGQINNVRSEAIQKS